jgi:hypothetical protein
VGIKGAEGRRNQSGLSRCRYRDPRRRSCDLARHTSPEAILPVTSVLPVQYVSVARPPAACSGGDGFQPDRCCTVGGDCHATCGRGCPQPRPQPRPAVGRTPAAARRYSQRDPPPPSRSPQGTAPCMLFYLFFYTVSLPLWRDTVLLMLGLEIQPGHRYSIYAFQQVLEMLCPGGDQGRAVWRVRVRLGLSMPVWELVPPYLLFSSSNRCRSGQPIDQLEYKEESEQ